MEGKKLLFAGQANAMHRDQLAMTFLMLIAKRRGAILRRKKEGEKLSRLGCKRNITKSLPLWPNFVMSLRISWLERFLSFIFCWPELALRPWRGVSSFISPSTFSLKQPSFQWSLDSGRPVCGGWYFYLWELTLLRSSPNLQKELPAGCNCGCGTAPIVVLFLSFHKLLFRSNIFRQKCLVCTAPGFTQSFWIGVAEHWRKSPRELVAFRLWSHLNMFWSLPWQQMNIWISARIISLPTAPKLTNWRCLVMPYFPALYFPLGRLWRQWDIGVRDLNLPSYRWPGAAAQQECTCCCT